MLLTSAILVMTHELNKLIKQRAFLHEYTHACISSVY